MQHLNVIASTMKPAEAQGVAPSAVAYTEAPVQRLEQLDGLRTIAFLAVFFHHALAVKLLWAGVDLFFVLSGFLITGILLRQRTSPGYFRTFYYRRFLRIFPPYYLVLALAFALLPQARPDWPWYALYLSNIHSSFFTADVAPALLPMWSLAIEEQFYVLWPLVVFLCDARVLKRLCIALIIAAPALRALATVTWPDFRPVYHLLPTRMDLLAAGALVAVWWSEKPAFVQRLARLAPYAAAVAGIAFAALTYALPSFRTSSHSLAFNTLGYSLIVVVMTAVVTWAIPQRAGGLFRLLRSRPMVYLGTISYMMYLCHQGVLGLVHRADLPPLVHAAVALSIVVVCSALSWHLLEKPLQRFKNRFFSYSAATAAGPAAVQRVLPP